MVQLTFMVDFLASVDQVGPRPTRTLFPSAPGLCHLGKVIITVLFGYQQKTNKKPKSMSVPQLVIIKSTDSADCLHE